jgi:hypothetical protein
MHATLASVADARSTASRAASAARDACMPISEKLTDICGIMEQLPFDTTAVP